MGNSQTKEARSPLSASHRNRSLSDQGHSPYHGSRSHRSSRHDLSFLGIGGSSGDREIIVHEQRRETKQDREARRQEKERAARLKERERSMKEEHVDGGYLVTQGVYVGTEDFNKAVVRQLMTERRLAPFWRGLNDYSESWTEHQLIAAARGLPIPPPDQTPPELQYTPPSQNTEDGNQSSGKSAQFLTVPTVSGRPLSAHSENGHLPPLSPAQSLPPPTSPIASGTSISPLFRSRAKTLAALTGSSKNQNAEITPREIMLPHDPFVNGQPLEAYLYKDASECPICFLYYPPYLNRTRCCDQPICSECFVQIKRPDPHPPEHGESHQNAENGEERSGSDQDSQLVSEPSACPFCVQPEFGVTYSPPPFRRGLAYAGSNGLAVASATSPLSSSSSLGSMASPPATGRRRATSLSANDPSVITTDKVRPDWAQKLANARAHAARRSAAATALHTAAYLMSAPGSESRGFGRRGVLGRSRGSSSGTQTPSNRPTGSSALHALAFLSERRGGTSDQHSTSSTATETTEGNALAPARDSSRRSRIEDLEEMMMMEAIRLSLASEEERRRKEEKELRKEAKKKEKEAKKAEKMMRKNAAYSNSQSSLAILSSGTSSRVDSSSSSVIGEESTNSDKGKKVDRTSPFPTFAPSSEAESADINGSSATTTSTRLGITRNDSDSFTQPSPTEPSRPSHLRHVSTASSTSSSFDTGTTEHPDTAAASSNPALEPMFNFRSLAAVIGDEEKSNGMAEHAEHAEHVEDTGQQQSSTSATTDIPILSTPPTEDATHATSPAENQTSLLSQDSVHSTVPKELSAHSVEVSRETTV
ncbi:C2H2 zinc finger protein [Talaromyces stipitatus ATCC 10500]|uniref:Protein SIP5 n=1 Tax=Talaromyces stipitatus (strain ATCC 10500 / CBS 375.48 / QM 6759 / NRRL 1006) TaxID=441959 RepID=B8MC44_TALSN|nr:C2H2 zinc finger protein [Talaromyces stipitatus ATCC 10500]EED18490.1 C2H2 zinc finger protein [Talaromyces stipitatus ATCC 10500]